METVTLSEVAIFAALGLLGGLINAIIGASAVRELLKFKSTRVWILGALVGIVYCFLHSTWNYPNSVMAIVSGYAGATFIDSLVSKARH